MQERITHTQPAGGRANAYAADAIHPLTEPTLFYDPPYERPLEDEFAWHLVKYLTPAAALAYQFAAKTPAGTFWVDFAAEHGTRRVGFECGDLTTPSDEESERMRDALLVGTGAVDAIYRFRGADVLHRLHDCLTLVAKWDPELFSYRGHVNLGTLASPEARGAAPDSADMIVRLVYETMPDVDEIDGEAFEWPIFGEPEDLVVRRFAREHPAGWIKEYDRALLHFGVSPETLGERWAKTA